ncbi:beta-N-acetylhexosaminidase [Blastomyces gilchristii SLH14081]|uniref:Beta-N-acetylhexosaminidase n=1 Tax=Blastomyces gilchristii (strain SLH14081) TaxID=559298 RepID=A0A179UNE1_BLAGS|nr:beta-N-acetylhexosaminidase [Blastomyces gilchristii SLH14081]OAT09353.1 beta-N-acetylhexosaminidase [Blastomyces gilchristii SLH14081]
MHFHYRSGLRAFVLALLALGLGQSTRLPSAVRRQRSTRFGLLRNRSRRWAGRSHSAVVTKYADGLDADGYRPSIALNGADKRGTYYAAQTLRQLVDGDDRVPGIQVCDWPLMSIRGSIEGFYGIPWSHQSRLDHYVFYERHKINTYIYTTKDDLKLRHEWRDLYEGDALEQLKELVTTANVNHVDFTYALSPCASICYSSEEDFNITVTKFNQICDLRVHSFYIALNDIPLQFHCEEDKQKWENKGLLNLETVPTNYTGSQPDLYKEKFVNDSKHDCLFLNPLTGRAADLYKYLLGFTFNMMIEPYPSLPTLTNYANYMWNEPAYNADESMAAILQELSGDNKQVHEALVAFSDLNQNWPYCTPEVHLPMLDKDIGAFWAGWSNCGKSNDGSKPLCKCLQLLSKLLKIMPRMVMKEFATDMEPWMMVASQWVKACEHLIDMLDAHDKGEEKRAEWEFKVVQEWIEKMK